MLDRLIGATTPAGELKNELNRSARSLRRIAHRVANAGQDAPGRFDEALEAAGEGSDSTDLEAEMVALADEQIRYEVSTRLLQKVYQQARRAVRDG